MIDMLAILFIVGVFANFGYSKYRDKKKGVVGCAHCSKCEQPVDCTEKEKKKNKNKR